MRIDMRIAVTGKVFRRRQHAFAAHSFDECGDVARDIIRIFAEAARVDDAVVGIDVDVGDRRENVIDAEGARFDCGGLALLFGERRIARRADRHRRWPIGGVGESHPDARFEIGAH